MSAEKFTPNSDLYTYEYFLIENVCRLCWNVDRESRSTEISFLAEKILDCLDINLTHCSNPTKVCKSCCSKIEEFYEFKSFCKESDKKLRDIVRSRCAEKEYILPTLTDRLNSSATVVKIENIENSIFESLDSTDNFFTNANSDDCDNNTQPVLLKKKKTNNRPVSALKQKKVKNLLKQSPTYCNICHLNLECEKTLSLHNAENHGIEETGLYKCFGCEKRFKSGKSRTSHELNFCKGLKDGYKCHICVRYLPKRSTYEFHMRDHKKNICLELPENMFKCGKCLKLFRTKKHLKEHMSVHNCNKKNFVCDICGRVFTRQDYLHKHKLLHAGIKRHSCPHCDFKATQRTTLTVHIRKHTGERPYSCDMCPQRCISSSNLRAHLKGHLGVKKYECKICNRKFGYKASLEEHVSSTHERSELHPCKLCGAIYTRVRGLRRHLVAKHGKPDKNSANSKSAIQTDEVNALVEVATESEANIENKVENILIEVRDYELKESESKVRDYELKESESILLLKNQNDTVFVVDV